jgi:hypothetical protein
VAVLTAAGTRVEYLVTGGGEPVTVFAHGLAGSIPETRPFGSGVGGVLWGHRRTLHELIGGFLNGNAAHRHQG